MTNLEKMNELVGTEADKDQIMQWAYMNRVVVDCLHMESEFELMENSIKAFINADNFEFTGNELEMWEKFLDAEFVS
jgi:hypothetical protein